MEDLDNMLMATSHSPKRVRARDDEVIPHIIKSNAQVKRLRKAKSHSPIEKDRTRGRYACLGHRMKHKRCPLDCPERRPKPNQDGESNIVVKKEGSSKARAPRTSAKKHVLELEDSAISNQRDTSPSTSSVEREPNWDAIEWEGLGWDDEHCLKESEAWMDLKSSSHWEESKSREVVAPEDTKPTDDLTKFEEEEIIDSWLNDDACINTAPDLDTGDVNANETDAVSLVPSHSGNLQQYMNVLPKILLTRDMLERSLSEPYFNRLVQGCFVRVKVGDYKTTPVFRIAHIEEVQDSYFPNYKLTEVQTTTKGLSLRIGASTQQVFPIVAISNHPPTETDFRFWIQEMERSNISLDPTEVQQKEEIVRVLHLKYPNLYLGTPQEVDPMINY